VRGDGPRPLGCEPVASSRAAGEQLVGGHAWAYQRQPTLAVGAHAGTLPLARLQYKTGAPGDAPCQPCWVPPVGVAHGVMYPASLAWCHPLVVRGVWRHASLWLPTLHLLPLCPVVPPPTLHLLPLCPALLTSTRECSQPQVALARFQVCVHLRAGSHAHVQVQASTCAHAQACLRPTSPGHTPNSAPESRAAAEAAKGPAWNVLHVCLSLSQSLSLSFSLFLSHTHFTPRIPLSPLLRAEERQGGPRPLTQQQQQQQQELGQGPQRAGSEVQLPHRQGEVYQGGTAAGGKTLGLGEADLAATPYGMPVRAIVPCACMHAGERNAQSGDSVAACARCLCRSFCALCALLFFVRPSVLCAPCSLCALSAHMLVGACGLPWACVACLLRRSSFKLAATRHNWLAHVGAAAAA